MPPIIEPDTQQTATVGSRLPAWAPGLAALRKYRRVDLPYDLAGGIAVAAVTVPVGIANARLAGLPPEHGLYASILPLVVYAVLARLGKVGTLVMVRLMAFILLCIGIQIMWTGWAELNGLG